MGHSPKSRPMTAHGSYTSSINRLYPCAYSIGVVPDKRCCLCLPENIPWNIPWYFHCGWVSLHPFPSAIHWAIISSISSISHDTGAFFCINCKRYSPSFSLVIPLNPHLGLPTRVTDLKDARRGSEFCRPGMGWRYWLILDLSPIIG